MKIYEDFSSVLASARQTHYYPNVLKPHDESYRHQDPLQVVTLSQHQSAVHRHPSVREEQLGFQPKEDVDKKILAIEWK